jgi:hypothetical protein
MRSSGLCLGVVLAAGLCAASWETGQPADLEAMVETERAFARTKKASSAAGLKRVSGRGLRIVLQ